MILPNLFNSPMVRRLAGPLLYRYAALSAGPLFSDLVLNRDRELWIDPDPRLHAPNVCRNELPENDLDLSAWRCCRLWQRKLNNKLNAKVFVAAHGISVAQLYWKGKTSEEIPFDALPDEYVVKTSTGWSSRQVVPIVNGVNVFTNRKQSPADLVRHFQAFMSKEPYASGYILVEEFLQSAQGRLIPKDYKCWMFSGKLKFIQVINRLDGRHRWYHPDWQPVPDQMHLGSDVDDLDEAPDHLSEIVGAAELLAGVYDYPFVRIDLYDTTRGVVFGEFTPTPLAGPSRLLYTPFANRTFGRLWAQGLSNFPLGTGAIR